MARSTETSPPFHLRLVRLGLAALLAWLPAVVSPGDDTDGTGGEPRHWALIVTGLPGDDEHDRQFRKSADQIQQWLIESLEVPAQRVLRLPANPDQRGVEDGDQSTEPVTAETIRQALDELRGQLREEDTLWLFTLGHGNYDRQKSWFHVAGRDPSGEDLAGWLAEIPCREQIFWLTHSSSGWWIKPLAKPGRIVIAATAADDESNETEFPHALATVVRNPPEQLDSNQDQVLTVAELYAAVVAEVVRRFQADDRLRTEHAQLDDNHDGLGTEEIGTSPPAASASNETRPETPRPDGDLARATAIPSRRIPAADPSP